MIAVGLGYAFALPSLFSAAIALPLGARIAIAAALLLPLGVLLGVPLPSGIRLLGERHPGMLAWAWAINGAMSVLGASAAIFAALLLGFRAVAMLGAAIYALAWLLGGVMERERTSPR